MLFLIRNNKREEEDIDFFGIHKMKTEMLAMILAGGQGTRLGKLTKNIAKPAVPFGGRYRIIDFTLSNCVNSGINDVGVVTQYQPLALNNHIGNGASWGLDGINSGLTILQPYSSTTGEKWFEGTAHAIYQNISYIDQMDPQYVLILSGDHIYKMNYEVMLDEHIKHQAALTVAVIEVPLDETSRFGIMNTDENDRIVEFDEKPKHAKNNLASMGIYIFDWGKLRNILLKSYDKDGQMVDFGHHVIPLYIEENELVYAYRFKGYWKDVGTVESLWKANMEFIQPDNKLRMQDQDWRIYSKNMIFPPHFVGQTAEVRNSIVSDGCFVEGKVTGSVLSTGVKIRSRAVIKDSVIMPGATIGKNVIIQNAIVGEHAVVGDDTVISEKNKIAVVGNSEVIGVKTHEG